MLSVQYVVGRGWTDHALDTELSKVVDRTAACSSSLGIVAVDFNGSPTKTVKYNKKKHYKSKWITGAILKSINTKDKLYKTLAKTDSQSVIYQTLKKDFQQFQKTLKSTIRMAKKNVFSQNI